MAEPPIWKIPPDYRRDNFVLGLPEETWHLPRTDWRKIRKQVTGKGIVAAVLDTGVASHPILPTPLEARSFIPGESVVDENTHGTHCAGTLLGRDEDIGVAPDAELVVGKVMSNGGSGPSDGIEKGIRWATKLGVDVISLSLGGFSPYQPTIDAIREATARGIWVVIASGNSGFNGFENSVNWPAASDEGITTGATTQRGDVAEFSSGGSQLRWACPGENILSCNLSGGFSFSSGTSMATPYGAGIACLAKELMKREGAALPANKTEIHDFIPSITEDILVPGRDEYSGYGVPQATTLIENLITKGLRL